MRGIPGRVLSILKRVVIGTSRLGALFECQRCGFSLAEPVDECPECGAHAIVHYSFG